MALLPGFTLETPKQAKTSSYQRENDALAAESKKANSFLGIAKETGRGLADFGRSIIGGAAGAVLTPIQAGVSAATGRAPAALPALRLPVIGKIQVETAQKAAERYTLQGDSVLKASAKGFGNFLLNEPLAVAPKLALTGVAIGAKTLSKLVPELSRAKSVQQVVDILYKRAPEIPPQTVETLAPHLAATKSTKEIESLLRLESPKTRAVVPDEQLVNSVGKDNLRTAMIGLNEGGYSLKQVSQIMEKVIERNNTGRFTPTEISAVARTVRPARRILPPDSEVIKGPKTLRPQTASLQSPQKPATVAAPQQSVTAPSSVTSKTISAARSNPVSISKTIPQLAKSSSTPTGTSKLGASVEAKAIEKKLTDGFEGTAGYDAITVKDQARRVDELIKNDIAGARRIVRGEDELPAELRGSALVTGLEEYALKQNNAEMLRELANSPLTAETSRAAQELRLLAERTPDSAVAILRDVAKARLASVERKVMGGAKKAAASTVKAIKGEIEKAAKKQTWDEFVTSITC